MKSKDQKTGFRRVPGGYRRADVNAFILSNDREMASVCEGKDAEISSLQKQTADLTAERDELSEKLAECEKALETVQKENADLLGEIAVMRQKVADAEELSPTARSEAAASSSDNLTAAEKTPASQKAPAPKPETKKRSYTIAFPLFKKAKR